VSLKYKAEAYHLSIHKTEPNLTWRDRWIHIKARLGIRRSRYRLKPGLYAFGNPRKDSPVLVTANYKLSFDALRKELSGLDSWIMILDTRGINVWCAAGKGTFGTEEIVRRIEAIGLAGIVSHRRLILPQLGAAGVSAHEVQKRSEFRVEYGPVYASDLPYYLRTGRVTPEMRRVRFPIRDRLLLIPVEMKNMFFPALLIGIFAFLLGGIPTVAASIAAVLAGIILFPILLPWIPTRNFSSKGYVLGGLVVLPFVIIALMEGILVPVWQRILTITGYILALPTVTAFLSLNFTGSTPFTSRSAVKKEMKTYIPVMAWALGSGLILLIIVRVL
jgi:hypothetical protein